MPTERFLTSKQLIPTRVSWKREASFNDRKRLFLLPPLPNEDVIPTAELFLQHPKSMNSMPIFCLGVSMVENPTPETDQALTMLAEDLERFRVKQAILSIDALQDIDYRMDNVQIILVALFTQTENAHTEFTPSQKRLFDVYMQIRNDAIHVFSRMGTDSSSTSSDLVAFLNYSEFEGKYSFLLTQHGQSRKKSQTFESKDGVEPPHQFMNMVQKNEHVFSNTKQEAWNRLRKGWDWDTIKTVVSYLPRLAQPIGIAVMASLWDNLSALPHETPQEGSGEEEYGWILGTAPLLRFYLHRFLPLLEPAYPDIVRAFKSSVDSTLPSSFPIVLKNLLSKLTVIEGEESTTKALIKIHKGIDTLRRDLQIYRRISSQWLTVLLAMRSEFSSSNGVVRDLVGSLSAVDPQLRQIALDQQPGELYLTSDGDIIPIQRTGAFLLHTSSKPKETEAEVLPKVVPETPKEAPPPVLIRITKKPFVGTVDVIEEKSIPYVLDALSARTNAHKEGDELLDAFSALSEQWKYKLPSHMTLIYLPELNKLDPVLIKAEKMGIGAVIVDRSNHRVTFLSKDKRTAIEALLTPSGELEIPGARDGFIGSALHLYLNILSLGLAMRVFYQGVPKDNTLTAAWNRTMCSDLPRLRKATMQDDTSIAIPATFSKDEPQMLLIEEAVRGKQG